MSTRERPRDASPSSSSRGGESGGGGDDGKAGTQGNTHERFTPSVFDSREDGRREAYLDNAKCLLMAMVVWNHSMQEFLTSVDAHERRGWCGEDTVNVLTHKYARTFYLVLNVVGMPAFTMISGYLSRGWMRAAREDEASAANTLHRIREAGTQLLGTYCVWQLVYMLINYYDVTPVQWWSPIGVTWYLLALYLWRNSILVYAALKDLVIVVVALAMGLFVGFTETATTTNGYAFFDWQRLFVYSLYFYFGLTVVKPEHIKRIYATPYAKRAVPGACALVGVFATLFATLYVFGQCFDELQWNIWAIKPYDSSSIRSMFVGMLHRLVLYVFTFIASFAFMAVVPSNRSFITDFGARTLYCYLLHILLVRGFTKLINLTWGDAPLSFRLSAGALWLPLIVSVALMSPAVMVFRPIIQPNFNALWRVEPRVGANLL